MQIYSLLGIISANLINHSAAAAIKRAFDTTPSFPARPDFHAHKVDCLLVPDADLV
jgi:hypothetical protein